jgi:hypothetical protein
MTTCNNCEANSISSDRFDPKAKELHDKCSITVQANGQTEQCGCMCNLNTVPTNQ